MLAMITCGFRNFSLKQALPYSSARTYADLHKISQNDVSVRALGSRLACSLRSSRKAQRQVQFHSHPGARPAFNHRRPAEGREPLAQVDEAIGKLRDGLRIEVRNYLTRQGRGQGRDEHRSFRNSSCSREESHTTTQARGPSNRPAPSLFSTIKRSTTC